VYEISVVSYQGNPPATPISAVFGADGGTIGRGATNTLVLPDPNRFVSRVQARVACRGLGIAIANASTANPLLVNDRELESGAETALHDGDELRIGLYVLHVRNVEAAQTRAASGVAPAEIARAPSTHPAAESPAAAASLRVAPPSGASDGVIGASMPRSTAPLVSSKESLPPVTAAHAASAAPRPPSRSRSIAGATSPLRPPAAPEPARAAPPPAAKLGASALGPVDPLQLEFGQSGDDPFADLMQSAVPGPPQAGAEVIAHATASPSPSSRPARLLGSEEAPRLPPLDSARREVPIAASPQSPAGQPVPDHVWDDLARLAPSSPSPEPSPTALPASFDAFAQPSDGARNAEDPLAEFAQDAVGLESFDKLDTPIDALFADSPSRPKGGEDVIPDPHAQVPDPLAGYDSLDPIAIFDNSAGRRDPLDNAFRQSERDDVPELEGFFRPSEPRVDAAGAPESRARDPQVEALSAQHGTKRPAELASRDHGGTDAPPEIAKPFQRAVASADSDKGRPDDLLREFLVGAGIPHATMQDTLTPALMRRIGRMLAIAVQGTIELIAARALVKREVKADVTIIASTRNNPLKFLPDAESALLQMFGARIPGFMDPVEAMEDAYRDLRAHEVGVIAGMHAALAEVLRRFEPAELERRLKPGGVLEGLLPNSRQARLWETFAEMYIDISREAQDDFQSLFGKAFLQAYENEVSRLKGQ